LPPFLGGLFIGLAVVLLWLFIRPKESERIIIDDESIDRAILGDAESEVAELDVRTTPQEAAEELPDWGPGAPKG
jgi:hypothetical protein